MPPITVSPTVNEPGQQIDRVTAAPGILDNPDERVTGDRSTCHCHIPATPVCGACAEFLPLGLTPTAGTCLLHSIRVQLWEHACSQYYPELPLEGAGSDAEF